MVVITPELLDSLGEISTESDEKTPIQFISRYLEQSKQISQIIAFIWLHLNKDDEHLETAKELDRYFKNTKIQGTEYKLKDLLFAKPNGNPFKLLQKVFGDGFVEPLFGENEEKFYDIVVDVDRHRTELKDPLPGQTKWTAVMGYPPRPLISDDGQLSAKELDDWIKDKDPNHITASNPYIPLCCS